MITAKWCCENINSGDIRLINVKGEMDELLQTRTLKDFKEELGDVFYFLYCYLYCRFNINLPMFGAYHSITKFSDRIEIWWIIFETCGLRFHPKYLINGSNYEKPEKITSALYLARLDQNGGNRVYEQMVIEGKLISQTETHYITQTGNGVSSWSKLWYRLMVD